MLSSYISAILAAAHKELCCSICVDLLHEPNVLCCGHVFCQACLTRALQIKKACPLCNQPASDRSAQSIPVLSKVVALSRRIAERHGIDDLACASQWSQPSPFPPASPSLCVAAVPAGAETPTSIELSQPAPQHRGILTKHTSQSDDSGSRHKSVCRLAAPSPSAEVLLTVPVCNDDEMVCPSHESMTPWRHASTPHVSSAAEGLNEACDTPQHLRAEADSPGLVAYGGATQPLLPSSSSLPTRASSADDKPVHQLRGKRPRTRFSEVEPGSIDTTPVVLGNRRQSSDGFVVVDPKGVLPSAPARLDLVSGSCDVHAESSSLEASSSQTVKCKLCGLVASDHDAVRLLLTEVLRKDSSCNRGILKHLNESTLQAFLGALCGPFVGSSRGSRQRPSDGSPGGGGGDAACHPGDYAHYSCLLWSSEVTRDANGCLQNAEAAIKRGRSLRCHVCGRIGATLGCADQKCRKSFHVLCAMLCGPGMCTLQRDLKQLRCSDHPLTLQRQQKGAKRSHET